MAVNFSSSNFLFSRVPASLNLSQESVNMKHALGSVTLNISLSKLSVDQRYIFMFGFESTG